MVFDATTVFAGMKEHDAVSYTWMQVSYTKTFTKDVH